LSISSTPGEETTSKETPGEDTPGDDDPNKNIKEEEPPSPVI
tara:strand:+ start:292 stop:417 length:126 start_codon:yes stop_codon:yes gene_type:complete